MDWVSFVKRQFDLKNYTAEQVNRFVEANKITEDEAAQIVAVPKTEDTTE